jgi:hypothetical protein
VGRDAAPGGTPTLVLGVLSAVETRFERHGLAACLSSASLEQQPAK